MQSLEYEINTLFTSNGQTPFTSLGFGLGTNRFEREIQKAILNIRIKGLGSEHRTAIFPKLIFTLKRGLNLEEGTLNYDIKQLALECATKRMYPDVLSYDKVVDLTGSFKVPMGCRSFLQGWKDENGVEVNSGRMNLGVVTVNLPRIALESEGDMTKVLGNLQRAAKPTKSNNLATLAFFSSLLSPECLSAKATFSSAVFWLIRLKCWKIHPDILTFTT